MSPLPTGGTPPEVPPILAGRLLVATPTIGDANFHRTVIVLVNHNADGSLGVVINRPSERPVTETLPRWSELVCAPTVVFDGGPVQPSTGLALARCGRAVGDQLANADALAAVQGLQGAFTVDLESDAAIAGAYIEDMRLFSGYAGWSPRQLEAEIEAGAWFVADADLDDLFTDNPSDLWSEILRRQRGNVRWFANYPADPRDN